MNKTLQDRLVKELRLRGISTMEAGNAFLPEFMADYNQRFGRMPKNSHDAHRPLRSDEDLSRIFTWQEERTMSRNLVVHFKRVSYLVEPGPETLPYFACCNGHGIKRADGLISFLTLSRFSISTWKPPDFRPTLTISWPAPANAF
jgi:hypothetical protein